MTAQDFCYWLQDYMELENPTSINADRIEMIKEHLNLVFNKVTAAPKGLKPDRLISPPTMEPVFAYNKAYMSPTGLPAEDLLKGMNTPVSC